MWLVEKCKLKSDFFVFSWGKVTINWVDELSFEGYIFHVFISHAIDEIRKVTEMLRHILNLIREQNGSQISFGYVVMVFSFHGRLVFHTIELGLMQIKYVFTIDLNKIGKWKWGIWWKIKTKIQFPHDQFQNIFYGDNHCEFFFIIDINGPWHNLLLLCFILFVKILITHLVKLGYVIWFSFDYVFAHMCHIYNYCEFVVVCTNSNMLITMRRTTIYKQIPISCAWSQLWNSCQNLGVSTLGRSYDIKQWE